MEEYKKTEEYAQHQDYLADFHAKAKSNASGAYWTPSFPEFSTYFAIGNAEPKKPKIVHETSTDTQSSLETGKWSVPSSSMSIASPQSRESTPSARLMEMKQEKDQRLGPRLERVPSASTRKSDAAMNGFPSFDLPTSSVRPRHGSGEGMSPSTRPLTHINLKDSATYSSTFSETHQRPYTPSERVTTSQEKYEDRVRAVGETVKRSEEYVNSSDPSMVQRTLPALGAMKDPNYLHKTPLDRQIDGISMKASRPTSTSLEALLRASEIARDAELSTNETH